MQTYTITSLVGYEPLITNLLSDDSVATRVLALHGDLGAGKTTFVQQLGKVLGVTDVITSPTFAIMAHYQTEHPGWQTLLHMDAYRIEDLAELTPLHFSDLLTKSNTIFCIEWAEVIAAALPPDTLHLKFSIDTLTVRTVTLVSHQEWLRLR